MIYNDLGALIGIIAIIIGLLRLKNGKMSLGIASLWVIIWSLITWISLFPESTNLFASLTGIGRGLDTVLIFGLILGYYLIFRMYSMIESMDREITLLVREIALKRDDITEKHENKDLKIESMANTNENK